jgi:hypothetical protein
MSNIWWNPSLNTKLSSTIENNYLYIERRQSSNMMLIMYNVNITQIP